MEIERLTRKGANTLILGWEGYGKTRMLRYLCEDGLARGAPCDVMVYFLSPGPPKDFLIRLGEELWKEGDLLMEVEGDGDRAVLLKALEKLKLRPLFELI